MSSTAYYTSAYQNVTSSGWYPSPSTATARPAPRPPLNGETNFTVKLDQVESRRCKYEIFNAAEKPDYDNRIDYGFGRDQKEAEKKARKRIDEIFKPYQPKPTLANFVPPIIKRVMP